MRRLTVGRCIAALAAAMVTFQSFTFAQDLPLPSPAQLAAMIEAAETTTPLPATEAPFTGLFYSAQFGSQWPPLPVDVLGLPFWPLGGGLYLFDDRGVDYDALEIISDLDGGGLNMMSSLNTTYAYANPVYLTNISASLSGTQAVASFSIAGGTNFVPYDILTTTDLATSLQSWSWLGIGYTSNRYTFSNQPPDHAYYILAKPSKTMTFGWGNNVVGQCGVPYGITNAIMVAAGGGQSLALLNDGNVVAWGTNGWGEGAVPTNLHGVAMIACGQVHDVALLTNGIVTAWGADFAGVLNLTEVPPDLTNATVVSAQGYHSLALTTNGTVVVWGYNPSGLFTVPSGLSNVVAISAGFQHNLAVKSDGTVVAWGDNYYGQCNVPAGLSNVVDVAAGPFHSLALRRDGTVVAWGDGSDGETNVPPGLTNVVAIAAYGDYLADAAYSLALKSDGTVVVWGEGEPVTPLAGLSNVIAIAGGSDHALAVRTGPPTPVITLEPTDQYQVAGGNVTFTARGSALYGVTYQWQSNAVNIAGATNATLTLTSVQAGYQAPYRVVVSNASGSITSPDANFYLVTPPVITSQTPSTNLTAHYQSMATLSASAAALGQTNGFPLSYHWQFSGTNIAGATSNSYALPAEPALAGTYTLTVTNQAGSTNVAWVITIAYDTLAYHLATNAVGRTNGFTPNETVELSGWTPAVYSATNMNMDLLTNSTWSTNFWLKGVQGLTATPIGISNNAWGQTLLTMVSPRHYLRATHAGDPSGMIAFLDTNNVVYWRASIQRVDIPPSFTSGISNDTSVGIIDADLPPSVGYLRVAPTNILNYLPTYGSCFAQGIGMNQDMKLFSQPMNFQYLTTVTWNSTAACPFGLPASWSITIRNGDSSDPEMFLVNGELVLVSHNFHVVDGPDYAIEYDAINQYMHYLSTNNNTGTDYQLSPIALTNWPAIAH